MPWPTACKPLIRLDQECNEAIERHPVELVTVGPSVAELHDVADIAVLVKAVRIGKDPTWRAAAECGQGEGAP